MDNKRTPKFKELVPRWHEQREKFKKKFWRGVIHLFAWIGIAVIYYAAFSFFFDTPLEYQMKHSTRKLRQEYDSLMTTVFPDVVLRVTTSLIRPSAVAKTREPSLTV